MTSPNFKTGTLWTGDNLPILRGLNSESVDLIYLDPPFNSNKTYSAPIGSQAAGAMFKDTWTLSDTDNAWHGEIADRHPALYAVIHAAEFAHGKSMKSYLIMMAVRLLESKRILKPTGSLYLHCDPTASHYLKALLDAIFGRRNFVNELVWSYKSGGAGTRKFAHKHDLILFYAKSSSYTFHLQKEKSYNREYQPYRFKGVKEYQDSVGWYTLVNMRDVWPIDMVGRTAQERTGYPTQKPLALLERIITASSNEGDVVLDPFCGCATSLVAAETLGRQWIGIDLSKKAVELVRVRMDKEANLLTRFHVIHRTDLPRRTDLAGAVLPHYRTQKHMLYGTQGGRCNGCLTIFPFRNMTIDHIVPQTHGGQDVPENLQLLCGACNSTKGHTRTQAALKAELKRQGVL